MAIKPVVASRGELSEFIGLGLTSIASYIQRGVFKPRKDGRFHVQDVVARIIKWQAHKIGGRGAGGGNGADDGKGSLTEARIQHTIATTESVALKTARARGQVVLLDVIIDVVTAPDDAVREGVLAYHSIAPQLVGLTALQIEDKLIKKSEEILDALSDPNSITWLRASEALENSAEAGTDDIKKTIKAIAH